MDSFTDDEVELLARIEHNRFFAERILVGWTLDESLIEGNELTKCSPSLVPWDKLKRDPQEWNRVYVRAMPELLKKGAARVDDAIV